MNLGLDMRVQERLSALVACLDEQAGRYTALRGSDDFGGYLGAKSDRADEELLTEPLLAAIIERVLGFPADAYFPQLGKSGLKPDFTPIDLVAHRFVLDAKSSDQDLGTHEPQIRRYITQRSLDYGVLFNLREIRVYRRNEHGHDPELSFPLLPLWRVARGEALPGPELAVFDAFCHRFAYREMPFESKVAFIREQPPWPVRLAAGEPVEVDVEFLVEQLRKLSRTLAEDAEAQSDRLDQFVALSEVRERRVLGELKLLALDIEPGIDLDGLPATLGAWRSGDRLVARVWRQFMLRVAYLALTRVVLYRAWEDVQFVDDYLHDGGFEHAYERLSADVRAVLGEAFLHGAERYRWLFGPENNYDWFRPREAALVDVLYALAPVPLGKLDADALGALYVSYVDEIDRDRLGQFFTPRPVVRFMLDRAGFSGPGGVFDVEGDRRSPRRVLDFATGSGGFLVEAARRVIDESGIAADDRRGLEEALAAIVRGFVGGEISPFPYYLTEVNVLLQVSRLLGRLRLLGETAPPFALGVLHVDTLTAKSDPTASLEHFDAELRADRGELMANEAYDLVPLDGEKRETFRRLRTDGAFDLVVGNPPYVAEANNKVLFERLRAIPAWRGIYRGKTDYLYYFLYLAVEKLAPGGRLCVITPAGWLNAGAADFLREKVAAELTIDEIFLFGSYRLFGEEQGPAPTPIVESMILVATKSEVPRRHTIRVVVLEDESAAGHPERETLLEEMARRVAGRQGRRGGVHVHDVEQAGLRPDVPWPLKHTARELAAVVVGHLDGVLADEQAPVETLGESWKPFMGIQTCADAYSAKIRRGLREEARRRVEEAGGRIGDPIYALPPGAEREPPWSQHAWVLVRSPEPEAVLYGALAEDEYVNLVRLTRTDSPPRPVLEALERWKPLLEARAEIARNPHRRWWETCWPRNADDLSAPKVIALHRTDRGRFALDEEGNWSPSGRMCAVVGLADDAPVAYLCGLLNSELLDLWYGVRGRVPRDVWRDYEPKPLRAVPYRRPDGDPRAQRVAEVVRELAANRRALLPHRSAIRDLGRIVKDPWRDGPVAVDPKAVVTAMTPAETVSVRLDPELRLEVGEPPLGKAHRVTPDRIEFRRARRVTGAVAGDPVRLDLLETLIGGAGLDDVSDVLLPKDLDAFAARVAELRAAVEALLAEGRALVEEIERLVCALYDVPDDLTDEIIAHAVARAGSSLPQADEA